MNTEERKATISVEIRLEIKSNEYISQTCTLHNVTCYYRRHLYKTKSRNRIQCTLLCEVTLMALNTPAKHMTSIFTSPCICFFFFLLFFTTATHMLSIPTDEAFSGLRSLVSAMKFFPYFKDHVYCLSLRDVDREHIRRMRVSKSLAP